MLFGRQRVVLAVLAADHAGPAAGLRPLAVDLRGFGDTDPEPVDATRGLRDYADDVAATIDALGLDECTWSAGAWAAGWCCSTWPTGPARTGWPR